jgi:hypothetical protein
LGKDGFGKSMAAFTSARSSGWASRGRLWLGTVRATTEVLKGTTIKACTARFATATVGISSIAVLFELGINSSGNHGAELGGFRCGFSRGVVLDIDKNPV